MPLGRPLCVGDREARADRQCGELIDRVTAGAPVRKPLFVEALGQTRVPFAGYRPDRQAEGSRWGCRCRCSRVPAQPFIDVHFSATMLCLGGVAGLAERFRHVRGRSPDAEKIARRQWPLGQPQPSAGCVAFDRCNNRSVVFKELRAFNSIQEPSVLSWIPPLPRRNYAL
jgi:hypothetical protein